MNSDKIFSLLQTVALNANPTGRARLASAVVHRGNIVSIGTNHYRRSHPLQALFSSNSDSVFLHAEIDAIKNALNYDSLYKCDIYIYRVKFSDSSKQFKVSGNAFPCKGCFRCIQHFGIRKILYSINGTESVPFQFSSSSNRS